MREREEKCIENFDKKPEKRIADEDLGIDTSVMLKCIIRKRI